MTAYFVSAMVPFVVEAKDEMDAYRQVRDQFEFELAGTAAEDWPLEISVRAIAEEIDLPKQLRKGIGA